MEPRRRGRWRSGCHLINQRGFFSPLTLLQQTKDKMEKSLCVLAAVLLLGLFSHGAAALMNDPATTESYTLTNYTTISLTVNLTEAVTLKGKSGDGAFPATEEPQLFTTTVRDKQLDTADISKGRHEEEIIKKENDHKTEDGKTKLGRKTFKYFNS